MNGVARTKEGWWLARGKLTHVDKLKKSDGSTEGSTTRGLQASLSGSLPPNFAVTGYTVEGPII